MQAPSNISLFSTPSLLRANKSIGHRQSVLTLAQALAETLDELNLSTVSLTERFAVDKDRFYITDSDLNQAGKPFARIAFRSWIAKTDRWKSDSKTVQNFRASLAAEYKSFDHARGAA